jgi:hypothetical protein
MFRRMFCWAWGHAVDNRVYRLRTRACTRSARECLGDDNGVVRVGHTLSCFLRHHTYERVGVRDGHAEYACARCGHPLLFALGADPYDTSARFDKRVPYLCGLFGHHVHVVASRGGGTEYAGLLLPRPLDQVRRCASRVRRIRMSELRTSVLVCQARKAGIGRGGVRLAIAGRL